MILLNFASIGNKAGYTAQLSRAIGQGQYTLFFYKNHTYKNVEAQITPKIKNIVVILLVAISISASDEI